MAETPKTLSQQRLLIGEGIDELRFFNALLKQMQISNIQVEEYGGKGKFDKYLRASKVRPGFANLVSVGITRDADISAEDAFRSVCGTLGAHGFAQPDAPGIITQSQPSVSIFILPDWSSCGMLEDLCIASIQNEPSLQCVEQYLECIRQQTNQKPNNLAKAKIHAWLACQIEPGKRLAEAAEAGYWNWDSPVFEPLKQFLQGL